MASTINADDGVISGIAGVKTTADSTGALNIQTNGTTAISISAAQVVSFPTAAGISFGGQSTFAAGSAAAPSISVTGDTNTGLFFPAADTIAFTEGGVESMRVDSAGDLLVGTTTVAQSSFLTSTPIGVFSRDNNAQLRVHRPSAGSGVGAGAVLFAANDGSGNQKDVAVIRSETTATNADGGSLAFLTRPNAGSLTEGMRLDSSGNVGIGTSSPSVKLQLGGATDKTIRIDSSNSNAGFYGVYQNSTIVSANRNPSTGAITDATKAAASFTLLSNVNNAYIAFATTATNNIEPPEKMRLDSSGNLGLGTTSPTTFSLAGKHFEVDAGADNYAFIHARTTNVRGFFAINDVDDLAALYTYTNHPLTFGTNNTERARIDTSGNLLVGTTSAISSCKVSIFNSGNSQQLALSGANQTGIQLRNLTSGDGWIIGRSINGNNANDFFIYDDVNNVTRFAIDTSGNVGIGTTSPSYRFQVQKTATATPAMMIGGGFYGGPRLQVYGLDDNASAWMGFGTDMSGGAYELSIYYSNASGSGRVSFGTYNGTTYTERMSLSQAGNLNVVGALSKGSGSFRIPHPLKENTHDLVHSFIEGPQADLIYRGKATLVNGKATINIDSAAGMTEGTFVSLCREVQCFTSNESDWDNVRGKVVGNLLTIESQNPDSDAVISWMVIGERQDKHMYDTDWTDDNGKVIVEPLKPVIKKSYN